MSLRSLGLWRLYFANQPSKGGDFFFIVFKKGSQSNNVKNLEMKKVSEGIKVV